MAPIDDSLMMMAHLLALNPNADKAQKCDIIKFEKWYRCRERLMKEHLITLLKCQVIIYSHIDVMKRLEL